jgi:hypothetical protein
MSVPLATIFHGDVTLEEGSDVAQFGYGDLKVNRKLIVSGVENSTGAPSVGSVVVDGGIRVQKNAHIHENLNVLYGITNLTETHIDTSNGATTITGGNKVDISVGAASQFVSTGGNLSLVSSNHTLQLNGGLNAAGAVQIQATNNFGGVNVISGVSGEVSLIAGSGGLHGTTSNGNLLLTANNGLGKFIVNSITNNQDLSIQLNGNTESQLKIESSGDNSSTRASLFVNTSNINGSILISNAHGLGSGSLTMGVGAGGFSLTTNTSGPVSIVSQAAPSTFVVQSSTSGHHMTVGVENETDSTLILKGSGVSSAVKVVSTSATGDISICNPTMGSTGKVNVFSGSGGFDVTSSRGSISMTSIGAQSYYTNSTTDDGQHLEVSVTGNTDSRVIISSSGTNTNAITMETNNSGGIHISAGGGVQVQSNEVVNIATSTPGVPVNIGSDSSTTRIYGDLIVEGTTTTINSNVVTIDDNIIVVNSSPVGSSDGGIAIKRYQFANNVAGGDVVQDSPEESGTVQPGDNSSTTVHLDATANSTDNYYNGWWIKLTGGTGANQVRRIKEYTGATRVAKIFDTSDQTGVLGNPSPVEGMDFITTPDQTTTYNLYPCHYVLSIWDESQNEFALVCSINDPADHTNIAHYADLHINNLVANGISTNTINNSLADITITTTLNDGNTTPVTLSGFPSNYGIYLVFVKPVSSTHRSHAIFMIGRVNENSTPGTVVRIISVKGTQYDQLDMQWPAGEKPQLFYRQNPIGGIGSTGYVAKLVSL